MNKTEALLARIMNHLATEFKNELILKGGMLLRLLNSPRQTQDLDYAWIRTKKRSSLAEEIRISLEKMNLLVSDMMVNSRGVFITILDGLSKTMAKVEIGVIKKTQLPPQSMTNATLANVYDLKVQVITTLHLAEAFANKIAATLERDLIRDLYDLTQFEPLTYFDEATLLDRLARLEIRRSKPVRISPLDATEMLREKLAKLTDKTVRDELGETMLSEQLAGLEHIIRASVYRIIGQIEKIK